MDNKEEMGKYYIKGFINSVTAIDISLEILKDNYSLPPEKKAEYFGIIERNKKTVMQVLNLHIPSRDSNYGEIAEIQKLTVKYLKGVNNLMSELSSPAHKNAENTYRIVAGIADEMHHVGEKFRKRVF